jgi:nicotinic acid phosphoribosyltransferase
VFVVSGLDEAIGGAAELMVLGGAMKMVENAVDGKKVVKKSKKRVAKKTIKRSKKKTTKKTRKTRKDKGKQTNILGDRKQNLGEELFGSGSLL